MKNKLLYTGLFIIVGLIGYAQITASPREVLEARYASVQEIKRSFRLGRCFGGGKSMFAFNYTATTRDGRQVNGYVCHHSVWQHRSHIKESK